MTVTKQRAYLRTLTDRSFDDALIDYYLEVAADVILSRAYPFGIPVDLYGVPERWQVLQCEVAAYLINRRGAEGETAHSENGISRSYESAGVPESMLRGIVPCCGIPE